MNKNPDQITTHVLMFYKACIMHAAFSFMFKIFRLKFHAYIVHKKFFYMRKYTTNAATMSPQKFNIAHTLVERIAKKN